MKREEGNRNEGQLRSPRKFFSSREGYGLTSIEGRRNDDHSNSVVYAGGEEEVAGGRELESCWWEFVGFEDLEERL